MIYRIKSFFIDIRVVVNKDSQLFSLHHVSFTLAANGALAAHLLSVVGIKFSGSFDQNFKPVEVTSAPSYSILYVNTIHIIIHLHYLYVGSQEL